MVRQEIEIISTIQNELEASDIASGRGTTGLSSKTVKNYIDRLYKTHQVNGGWNDLIEWVEEKYPSKNTQTSFFSAYLGASKHSPTFKKLIASQADEIRTTQMNLVKARTATQETHTIKKVVSYDELMELLPKLTGQEQLMLSLYTLMPPKRGDFGKVKLLKHPEVKDTEEANFLDVDNYELTIRDHKTRATFQFIKEKLPVEIRKYLRKSLKETTRAVRPTRSPRNLPPAWVILTPRTSATVRKVKLYRRIKNISIIYNGYHQNRHHILYQIPGTPQSIHGFHHQEICQRENLTAQV